MSYVKVKVDANAKLPRYASAGAAGMDIHARIDIDMTIPPQSRAIVPTGISVALPQGYEFQIRPRSGLAAKHGIMVTNSPGTIDSDYRGELKILLLNTSTDEFTITNGDRIAQMVLSPVVQCNWIEVADLDPTTRGYGGFGSTGI